MGVIQAPNKAKQSDVTALQTGLTSAQNDFVSLMGCIGTLDNGTTAAVDHVSGEFIAHGNKLLRATDYIRVGQEFTSENTVDMSNTIPSGDDEEGRRGFANFLQYAMINNTILLQDYTDRAVSGVNTTITNGLANVNTTITNGLANCVKLNGGDQTIKTSTTNGVTTLRIKSDAATNAEVYIRADGEGGNVHFAKGTATAEIDTNSLNNDGSGWLRVYTAGTGLTTKSWAFKQNGDFVNGNSVSMDSLKTATTFSSSSGTRNTTYTKDGALTLRKFGNVVILTFGICAATTAPGTNQDRKSVV